jgi:hypothetical protein
VAQATGCSTCVGHHPTFHLANYPDLRTATSFPDTVIEGKTHLTLHWCQVVLEADGWRIIVQPHPNIQSLRMRAISTRSFTLTGIGEIRRSDGKLFKRKQVIPVLDGLRIFLSFALSEWIAPLLIVGSNAKALKSWQRFSHFEVGQSWYSTGWLDEWHGDHLADAYPGFCRLWAKPEWQTAMTQAVTWLIQATSRASGREGAIAFCQIPLEMLAWMAFVDGEAVMDSKEFENLSASNKMQLLLHSCGIPIAVPSDLEAVLKVATAKGKPGMTGPAIAAEIRNTIIHPHKKNREKLAGWVKNCHVDADKLLNETRELFRWYIILVLLRRMDYQGEYANRLVMRMPGTVEKVPWVCRHDSRR